MVFAVILEPKVFELVSDVENSFWSEDSAGLETRQKIVTKSKIFLKMNFVFLSTGLIFAVTMLPIFGDEKDWFLVSIIFEKHFGTWAIILDWIYFSTAPFVVYSSIRLSGTLFYGTLLTHVQMFLINEHILQISDNPEGACGRESFHCTISQKLRFCIDHHVYMKR
jgi:hypothetical protein